MNENTFTPFTYTQSHDWESRWRVGKEIFVVLFRVLSSKNSLRYQISESCSENNIYFMKMKNVSCFSLSWTNVSISVLCRIYLARRPKEIRRRSETSNYNLHKSLIQARNFFFDSILRYISLAYLTLMSSLSSSFFTVLAAIIVMNVFW